MEICFYADWQAQIEFLFNYYYYILLFFISMPNFGDSVEQI